jgi:hypothetical protein
MEEGQVSIVPNVPLDEFAKAKLAVSVAELKSEKEMTAELLPS